MSAKLEFALQGARWARCALEVDGTRVEWPATGMSDDVLGDLLTALAAALRAGADSQTTFVDAPGCYVLTLTPQHAGRVSLRLMHFARWPAGGAQEGDLIFDQSARLRTFAGSALSVAQAAFKTEGDANYLEKWGTPFPHEAVAKLKAALDED